MTPKSDLVGTVPAAPTHGIPSPAPQFPTEFTGIAKDFSVVVSQAIARGPESAKSLESLRAQRPLPSKNFVAAQTTGDASEASEPAVVATAKSKRGESAVAPSKNSEPIDASTLSAVMAAMIQPKDFSADVQKQAPKKTEGAELSVESDRDSGSPAQTGKAIARSAVAPVEERDSQDEASHGNASPPDLRQSASEIVFGAVSKGSSDQSQDGESVVKAGASTGNAAQASQIAFRPLSFAPFRDRLSMGQASQAAVHGGTLPAIAAEALLDGVQKPVASQLQAHDLLTAHFEEMPSKAEAPQLNSSHFDTLRSASGDEAANSKPDAIPRSVSLTESTSGQGTSSPQSSKSPSQHGVSGQSPASQAASAAVGNLQRAPMPNPSPSENEADAGSQAVTSQNVVDAVKKEINGASPIGGTPAALSKPRMRFAGEKNDVAERAVQKLPSAATSDDSPDTMSAKAKPQAEPSLPKHTGESFFPGSLALFSANAALTQGLAGKGHELAQITDSAATQVERVANLVGQEVLTVRQSGANALAVSLKLDTHTELFLQLTNHDGQVQASLRCERGSIDHLGEHWTELQQSLARQNIQLMPMEDKTSTRGAPSATAASAGVASRPFDQSPQNRQQQLRDPQGETPTARVNTTGRVSGKTKTNNRSRQGWETWA